MATTVSMPQLGETIADGTILAWRKAVGEAIEADEVLLEVSTDKVDTEIPAPVAGVVLEILVGEGDIVEVGAPICVIGSAGEEPAASGATAPETPSEDADDRPPHRESVPPTAPGHETAQAPVAEPTSRPTVGTPGDRRDLVAPITRRLAREHGVHLSSVQGSGAGGRITIGDVQAVIDRASTAAPGAVAQEPAAAPAEPQRPVTRAAAVAPHDGGDVPVAAGDELVDLGRLRVRIGTNMRAAKDTAAHVWTAVEVDYRNVDRVRRAHRTVFAETEGFSLTYLPFVARATVDALRAFPVVNSSLYLEQRRAVFHRRIHLGVAIDLDQDGLVVATIRDADELSLTGLARRVRDLAGRARRGELTPDDVAGSTFTVTNPGPFGSVVTAPIINVPNTAILSTDTVAKRPVVVEVGGRDTIAIRPVGFLGLTWDHRAFDGSTAVLFLRHIAASLTGRDWEQELGRGRGAPGRP